MLLSMFDQSGSLKYEFIVIGALIVLIIFSIFFHPFFSYLAKSTENCELNTSPDPGPKIQCYIDLAVEKKDVALCEEVRKNYSESSWYNDCYLAIAKNDIGACENIEKIAGGDKVHPVNLYGAQQLLLTNYRNGCYYDLRDDAAICSKITDQILADDCYYSIAFRKKNYLICDQIEDKNLAGDKVIALSSFTDQQSFANYRNGCYYNLGQELVDAAACSKITDKSLADDCYYNVGIRTLNE